MARALKVCATPGCPALVAGTHCPVHEPAPWGTSTRASRLPQDWRRRRLRVLRRDGYRCRQCGAPATEVDHVQVGDDHHDSNLQSLCASCHRRKTQAEARRARDARS